MKGMNMKVERVTADRVKEKFSALKKKSTVKVENFQEFEQKFEATVQPAAKKVKVDNKDIE